MTTPSGPPAIVTLPFTCAIGAAAGWQLSEAAWVVAGILVTLGIMCTGFVIVDYVRQSGSYVAGGEPK